MITIIVAVFFARELFSRRGASKHFLRLRRDETIKALYDATEQPPFPYDALLFKTLLRRGASGRRGGGNDGTLRRRDVARAKS